MCQPKIVFIELMLLLSVKLLLKFPTCTLRRFLPFHLFPSAPLKKTCGWGSLEGCFFFGVFFLDSTKINSTKSAVRCILLLQEKWLVVCLFKQHRGLEHEALVLKGACGEKFIQGYSVCFNKSLGVCKRDGGGSKCLLSPQNLIQSWLC